MWKSLAGLIVVLGTVGVFWAGVPRAGKPAWVTAYGETAEIMYVVGLVSALGVGIALTLVGLAG